MIETVGGSANCLEPGVHIGEYRLLDVIGEGGFGIVYRARDISLDRIVAIKEYMPATLAGRKSSNEIHVRSQHRGAFDAGLRSFINEARLLAKFSHPALVHVYRFFEFNGTAYMVMRHYEGQTFRAFLSAQHDRMNQRMLSAIVSPVLDVVEMLHAADCYHRDIAPDNVFLQNSGMPVLLDFGAARRIIGDMTQALTMVLKPGFAPIEQYVDDGAMPQGAWTDIYQIGAMLYLAITGKPPATSVARMINDPVAALTPANHAGYSSQFLQGVHLALAVKPQDRPQTIAELKELLGITTFTSPIFTPWVNAEAPGMVSASAHLLPAQTTIGLMTTHASSEATIADEPAGPSAEGHIDWGQFGKPQPGGAADEPDARQDRRGIASAPINPDASHASTETVVMEPPESLGARGISIPAVRQSVPLARNATDGTTHPEVKFAAEMPKQSPQSTAPQSTEKKAGLGSNSASMRWIAIGLAAVAVTTMALWWGGKDSSSQSAASSAIVDEQQWRESKAVGTAAALDAYLAAQPTGKYRSEAFELINRLEAVEAPSRTTPVEATAEPVVIAVAPPPPERPQAPESVPKTDVSTAPGAAPSAADSTSGVKVAVTAKPVGDVGRVVLRVSPWGRISVNGNAMGTTPPLTQVELPEGTHRIEVSNPAAAPVVKTVQVKKGEPVVLSHQFE
ncbi:MAG: protein kinase domain-containing protein [Acidovorax sp.]|uniref:protein kinase domain-containing protein n=1 Tax=Acidovorax sp. TaxID=1872122 RepID=UPI00391C631D